MQLFSEIDEVAAMARINLMWEKIETAPHDGSFVWLAIKPHDTIYRLLCRYDSWNHQWRNIADGKEINYLHIRYWQICPVPNLPETPA